MTPQHSPYATAAYQRLKASEKGQSLISMAEKAATECLFDTRNGDINAHVSDLFTPEELYQAITLTGSLSLTVTDEGQTTSVDVHPYTPIPEETCLALLQDVYQTVENALLLSHSAADRAVEAVCPVANSAAILSVDMTSLLPEYEDAETVTEWSWVQDNASMAHTRTGTPGAWEFMVNLALTLEDIPEALRPIITVARAQNYAYILFHQGT